MSEVTCRFCKNKINKESAYKIGERTYYCNKEHYNLQQDKNKYKPQKTNKNGEPNERRLLLDYIQELYVEHGYDKHFINWKLITSILKRLTDDGMNYSGIQYTLWYCKEILEKDLFSDKSNSVLWCVEFEYSNAEQYYIQTSEIEDAINKFELSQEKELRIIKSKRSNISKYKLIDMTTI